MPADEVPEPCAAPGAQEAAGRLRAPDLAILVGTIAMLTALVPGSGLDGDGVRWMLALVAAIVGAGLLVLQIRSDRAAQLSCGFLLAAGLSTLLSPAPLAALYGRGSWFVGMPALFVVVGAWAIGRQWPGSHARSLAGVLVAGGAANAAAAVFQSVGILPANIPDIAGFDRATGWVQNPVHLATICGASMAVAARLAVTGGRWPCYLAAGLAAAGVNLAGGRAGTAAALVGVVLALRVGSWSVRGVVVACVVAGIGLSLVVGGSTGDRTVSAAERRGVSAGGRPGAWEAAWEAFTDRPLVGWGPGRFEALSTPRRTLESRRAEITGFADAHNWVVEYASTAGVLGLGLLLAWLIVASLPARGPLALFAVVVATNGLLQPASVAITPLAFLALGAAAPFGDQLRSPAGRWWMRLTVAVALAIGAVVAVGLRAQREITPSASGLARFDRARSLLPDRSDLLRDGIDAMVTRGAPADLAAADRLAGRLVAIEPDLAEHWTALAVIATRRGDNARARRAYEEALARDPWSVAALRGLAELPQGPGRPTPDEACGRVRLVLPRAAC